MTNRRLIACFDGTWNTPDSGNKPTNVVKLLRGILPKVGDVSQVVFYDKGVGTGGIADRIVGGASGAGLTANMVDGYRFLGNNYDKDDEIYIFGFSRGAYTARCLASLIAVAGILKPSHLGEDLHRVINEIYRNKELDADEKREALEESGLDRFADVRTKCIGVWDTVGSLGIPGDFAREKYLKHYLFHDIRLNSKVDVALHAIAIDEKRGSFSPAIWVSPDGKPAAADQVVEQVWFSGVHSNVGGSYQDAGLSDVPLDWMVKRVGALTDLEFDAEFFEKNCSPNVEGVGYESRSALYLSSRALPYQRMIRQTKPAGSGLSEWFRQTFEGFDRRNFVPTGMKTINEMLHVSAIERWNKPNVVHDATDRNGDRRLYRPVNLAAVFRARNVPVVDWNGEIVDDLTILPSPD